VNKTIFHDKNTPLNRTIFVIISIIMKLKFFIIGALFLTSFTPAVSQEKMTLEEYIERYKNLAVKEMEEYNIPASITLAQGILESENGNSPLAQDANNHFGIKCHDEWAGMTYYHDDDEEDECFRKYDNPEESFRDHSEFLKSRDRYQFLFNLDITDYKGWAYGLKEAGYATNPRYPELLIKIIEENGLEQLDQGGSQQSTVSGQQSAEKNQNARLRTQNSSLSTQHSEPPADVFEISGSGGNDRIVFINNGVKFIIARKGDDFERIASEFNIYSWQIWFYNDISKDDRILAGQKVYLERKKGAALKDIHIVQAGEDLHSISQDYGIRMKALCRLNGLKAGDRPSKGEKLRLK
jgi:uncharacterized FlgJ-related protein/LysM repeat protein